MTIKKEHDTICNDCRFWDADGGENNPYGYCRVDPPVVLEDGASWPRTGWSDWCGKFKVIKA